jgi:hypothetical protein
LWRDDLLIRIERGSGYRFWFLKPITFEVSKIKNQKDMKIFRSLFIIFLLCLFESLDMITIFGMDYLILISNAEVKLRRLKIYHVHVKSQIIEDSPNVHHEDSYLISNFTSLRYQRERHRVH